MSHERPVSSSAGRLEAGDVVAQRYRVTGVVGRGGMGAVYRASQLDTGVEVALKVLLTNYASSEVDAKRFRREASLVQDLRHPNIVKQLDFGQTERGVPYIAFELLHGQALSQRLRQAGRLEIAESVRIARHVLQALSAAHDRGIVHRDIKPQNIFLLDTESQTKLLDFGIAKTLESDGNQATQLTASGQMIGTPHYMAPEQVRGLEVGPRTDLYALGLILAEMVGGERVVKGDAIIEVYITHVSDDPLELHPLVRDSVVGEIVKKAIAKDPAKRYRSAQEMLLALEQVDVGAVPSSGAPTIDVVPADNDLAATMLMTAQMQDELDRLTGEPDDLLAKTVDHLAQTTEALEPQANPLVTGPGELGKAGVMQGPPEGVGKTIMLPQELELSDERSRNPVAALDSGLAGLIATSEMPDLAPNDQTAGEAERGTTRMAQHVRQMPSRPPGPASGAQPRGLDGLRRSSAVVPVSGKPTGQPMVFPDGSGAAGQGANSTFQPRSSFHPGHTGPAPYSGHGPMTPGAVQHGHRPHLQSYSHDEVVELAEPYDRGARVWLGIAIVVALIGLSALGIILILRYR